MKTAGEILKKTREKQGLTLEEIAKKTRIRLDFLRAVEEGDYKKLPPLVYIKGFIRNYALVLNLDVEKMLAFFRREYQEKEKKAFRIPPQPLQKPLINFTPSFLIGSFASVAIVVFLLVLFWQYHSFAGTPVLLIEQPQEGIKLETSFTQVVGKADKNSEVFVNGQKIKVESSGVFSLSVGLNSGLNVLTILARNKVGKEVVVQRHVEVEVSGEVAKKEATPILTPPIYTALALEVAIGPNSVWLQVFCDSAENFQGVLMSGVSRKFDAQQKIVLKTGNAGSTEVTLNGEKLGKLGEEGEVVERVFKREQKEADVND